MHAWTAEELAGRLGEVRSGRDFARGEAAWRKATCAECHRIGANGGSTGPDLTGAAGRFNARDLLTAILSPSETISDQYQETEVRLNDGRILVGRVTDDDGERIVVRVWSPREEDVEVARDEVALRRPAPLSRMPSGLVDVLERDEVLDLMAYVLAGGSSEDPAFAGGRSPR